MVKLLLVTLAKSLFIVLVIVGFFAPILSWMERKQGALIQDRIGANRASLAGISLLGLLQPAADAIKLLGKENVVPEGANRALYAMAPLIAAIAAVAAFAVIPYGGRYALGGTELSLVAADIDWGVLYVLAVASLASYGAVLGGWASNGHWSLLGSVRAGAQMISYGVAMGLTLVPLFMIFGTLRLTEMGVAQDGVVAAFAFLQAFGFPELPAALGAISIPAWGLFLNPLAFVLFLTCAMAASQRPPFDLPEAGSELVAGYLTEYSGVRFGLFALSGFIQVAVIGGLVTAIFLGGWTVPWLSQSEIIGAVTPWFGVGVATGFCMLLHVVCFFVKTMLVIGLQMLIRWSLPRYRYDQLMDLCWKVILPASLLNIFATAFVMLALGEA